MGLERLEEIDDLLLFDAALVESEQAVSTHQLRNDRHMVPVEVELEAAQKEVRSIDVKIDRLSNLLAGRNYCHGHTTAQNRIARTGTHGNHRSFGNSRHRHQAGEGVAGNWRKGSAGHTERNLRQHM